MPTKFKQRDKLEVKKSEIATPKLEIKKTEIIKPKRKISVAELKEKLAPVAKEMEAPSMGSGKIMGVIGSVDKNAVEVEKANKKMPPPMMKPTKIKVSIMKNKGKLD